MGNGRGMTYLNFRRVSGKKAQSFAEYIIVFFIFMAIVVFLFTTFFSRNQPEVQKIAEQSSNILAQALARLVFETPGQNVSGSINWEANCDATQILQIGLAHRNSTYIIPSAKMDCYRKLRPHDITDKFSGISAEVPRVPYRISAVLNITGPASCATAYSSTPEAFSGICNRLCASTMYFSIGNLTQQGSTGSNKASLRAELFFPIVNVSLDVGTIDTGDSVNATPVASGTKVTIDVSVNRTDHDKFSFTTSSAPDAVFIRSFSYRFATGENVGNFTISNSTNLADLQIEGAESETTVSRTVIFAPQQKTYGEARRFVVLNSSDGTLYQAITSVRTSRRQVTDR